MSSSHKMDAETARLLNACNKGHSRTNGMLKFSQIATPASHIAKIVRDANAEFDLHLQAPVVLVKNGLLTEEGRKRGIKL